VNTALERLAKRVELHAPSNEGLRLEFGYACALRVKHLLEEPAVAECLLGLGQYLSGSLSHAILEQLAAEAARLANHHQGSNSIDGCGHAAVSATYAVANALAGKALPAAEYAAYATVYGQGGYGAVADRESFEPEFAWQVQCLASLAGQKAGKESEAEPFGRGDAQRHGALAALRATPPTVSGSNPET
jgi:hypothetical protein